MNGGDLYQPSSQAASRQVESLAAQAPTSEGGDFFGIDFGPIVVNVNYFVLAWTIFYSVLFVSDFFFYRVKYNDGEIPRYHDGEKSMKFAATMWWTYLMCLAVFALYLFVPKSMAGIFGIVSIAVFILKVVIVDLPKLPILSSLFINDGNKASLFNKIFSFIKDMPSIFNGFFGSKK